MTCFSELNMALLDPPRYGWSAGGSVVDLITPQEALKRRRRSKGKPLATARRTSGVRKGPKTPSAPQPSPSAPQPSPSSLAGAGAVASPLAAATPTTTGQHRHQHQEAALLTSPLANLGPVTTASVVAASSLTSTAAATPAIVSLPTMIEKNQMTMQSPSSTRPPPPPPPPPPLAVPATTTQPTPIMPLESRILQPTPPATQPPPQPKSAPPPSLSFKSLCPATDEEYQVLSMYPDNSDNVLHTGGETSKVMVDMYTYHRGREGLEMGDDLEATDSGSAFTCLPKLRMQLHVKFPLSDDGDYWDETVEWNVAEPPIILATQIAQDFGLGFGETQDLIAYLQQQIDAHRGDASAYPEPPVVFNDLRDPPPYSNRSWHLYGSNVGVGGMPMMQSKKKKKAPPGASTTAGVTSKASTSSTPASNKASETAAATTPSAAARRAVTKDYVFKSPPEFRKIVHDRAKQECSFANTALVPRKDLTCHLCAARKPQCFQFPCLSPHHIYCAQHLQSICSSSSSSKNNDDITKTTAKYCPVCCVTCPCQRCSKRLDQVAIELQKRTPEGGNPVETPFENILLYCAGKTQTLPSSNKKGGNKSFIDKLICVPKVPKSEFPSEMCGARDMEPGTEKDYRTIFTASGAYLHQKKDYEEDDVPTPPAVVLPIESEGAVPEDGNVDYCHGCRGTGNLLCCDHCPRAFHEACISDKTKCPPAASGEKWECPVCKDEKQGLPHDSVRGKAKYDDSDKTCLDMICAAFVHVQEHDKAYLETMLVLAMILEMLDHLMDYDFGYMFAEPVDVKAIPEYAVVVKKPMDLGTIADRLVNGHYAKLYKEGNWDDVIAPVLMDIELVWHNCFLFNFEGSSIYRMAQVHARRSRNTRKKSFEYMLSQDTKKRVADFVAACDAERASIVKAATPSTGPKRQNNTHHIRVPWAPGGKCRTVAVLDPDSGRVVKLYTTLRSACMAAYYIQSLGRKSEWNPLSDYTIKHCIKRGRDDPKLTLFGYRWVFYDELRLGEVVFGPHTVSDDSDWTLSDLSDDTSMIQMMDGPTTYLFLSIHEAISVSMIPKNAPLANLRDRLITMPFNQWVPLCGLKWRKVTRSGTTGSSPSPSSSEAGGGTSAAAPHHVAIIKEDTVTGRRLMGFDSIKAAYEDWCRERTTSPTLRKKGYSMDFFKKDYLTGRKRVDGLLWRALTKSEQLKLQHVNAVSALETHFGLTQQQQASPKRPLNVATTTTAASGTDALTGTCSMESPPLKKVKPNNLPEHGVPNVASNEPSGGDMTAVTTTSIAATTTTAMTTTTPMTITK